MILTERRGGSRTAPTLVLLLIISGVIIAGDDCLAAANFKGALYESLFFNFNGENPPDRLLKSKQVAGLPEPTRERFKSFCRRGKKFKSRLPPPGGDWIKAMAVEKKVALERGMVSLISAKGIQAAAIDFLAKAPIYYEWEGMSDGPLAEAAYAEKYLKKNPATPLKPFLILFLMHRYRCAYECLETDDQSPPPILQDDEVPEPAYSNSAASQAFAVRSSYESYRRQAMKHSDPLVGLIAEDIDRQ